jgi:predicted TIM-barrel fold metal-dependent hydrolase
VDRKYRELANPAKWAQVLAEYPSLRLNLAHFGAESKDWRNAIARLILERENVYTDISYRGVEEGYYAKLRKFLDRHVRSDREKLMSHIIFGSDFMVNLMAIESYGRYMDYFANTDEFALAEKEMLCSKNPERFLFI